MAYFVQTREIVERVKDVISREKKGYVFDKDVADALSIKISTLRMHIYKDTIPFRHIAEFCIDRNIKMEDILT